MKFLRFEYSNDTEAIVLLMQAAEGGAFEIGRLVVPIDNLRTICESLDSFLQLKDAGFLGSREENN